MLSASTLRHRSVFHEDVDQPTLSKGEIVPAVKRAMENSGKAILKFSDLLVEWTPFLLTITYYVCSTCIYVFCPPGLIKAFYFILMVTNFYVSITSVIEAFLGMSPIRESRAAVIAVQRNNFQFPTPDHLLPIIDLVIVAYLPNERDIVKQQVYHALDELIYPKDRLRIHLVYNTPAPIEPLESELLEMEGKHSQLHVTKVPGSKSKADNLNYFFKKETGADLIAIFDCDHFPHPYNPRWAAERFVAEGSKVDIVQGRCVIYNTDQSFLSKMIALEFDKIYAVSHPGRSRLFGFGLFCGSNGYWRADLLRGHEMHGHMLCEDIDSALRAYGEGKNAVHDMNVISYEMAPTNFMAFWKQRMRWAQGWTQASIRHMPLLWNNPPEPAKKRRLDERFGVLSLLLVREFSYYLVTQHTCLLLSFVIVGWPKNVSELIHLIFFRYPLAEWFFFGTIVCLILTLLITETVRSEFTSWRSMIAFSIVYIPYLVLMATMGLYGHFRQIIKYSSWNPTSRK